MKFPVQQVRVVAREANPVKPGYPSAQRVSWLDGVALVIERYPVTTDATESLFRAPIRRSV
jgi:hypothetical protein